VRFAHDAWALTDVPVKASGLVHQQLRWNRSIIRNRLRKFRSVFNPFNANFSFRDAGAAANILFFQVALSISFFAYLFWLVLFYPDIAPLVILTVNLVYVIEDLFIMGIGALLYHERVIPRMLLYSPLTTFFKGYFLRFVRLTAYIDELIFRRSYRDSFYPTKVRNNVEQF
jgi:cellulose synthase/poly-beta-1,6-N-acetylglucosamine synthase-like glycosyltransferase